MYNDNQTLKIYVCLNCTCVFGLNPVGMKKCIHCGSANIEEAENRFFSEYEIVPFMQGYSSAYKAYKKKVAINPLLSFRLKTKKFYKKMSKIFIPCTLYHIEISGSLTIIGKEQGSIRKNEMMYSTKMNYQFLDTTITELDNSILNSIYDAPFQNSCSFDSSKVTGCFVGSVPQEGDENALFGRIQKHVMSIIKKEVSYPIKSMKENHLEVKILEKRRILMPVYYLDVGEKGKKQIFLMNGQTGKVYFDAPPSILSLFLFSILVFGITFFLSYLLELFL